MAELSRRRFLGSLAGAGVAGAGLAVAGTSIAAAAPAAPAAPVVAFQGEHQAGISTDVQNQLAFAAFDVTTPDRDDLVSMLQSWTTAAAAMAQGAPVPGSSATPDVPPADSGEADGLTPSRLTMTIGFGPSMFDDRFGLASRRPAALQPLPALPGELLDGSRSNGDIAVQACADDPQVAFHAIRSLARLGRGTVVNRWTQLGFGRTSTTGAGQSTPRNLMGFKDGTRNIRGDDTAALDQHVWVGNGADQAWMRGGTYLVARRIRMFVENWDRDYLSDQQEVFGRTKSAGAPLTGTAEFDTPDFGATGPDGTPVIADNAHIRLAAFENNNGLRILRRGYSFNDGIDPTTGDLEAGLFFISFQSDPATFVTLQRKLGSSDALNEYIQHVASGLFACPPGVTRNGDYWGSGLFEA
ncbi:iron uptake transporter deferrochelatase/peroxidase subunit [Pseudonocardia xinjiangensis]|uniref:Deferrochelatase n=1 Tax=Pseudonocardia xinjiangensis TaxID=75289 RepID=A0ABX1RDF8_9PSEU|nr:iron uptake transporter deferrochelatase/peroxidase subunit [Pseudonocardia xinjiangensis]NMH78417.1 deferrochelatase/peroxidase EfeB [Pseudonocardia xinjiangensis]